MLQAPLWRLPAHCRTVDLLSDVHLEPGMPRTAATLDRHLRETPADAVILLGDLFEVWVGDDARHSGFEAEATELFQQAAARKPMAFLPGNRDFLIGADWLAHCGITGLPDPVVWEHHGRHMLLSHGDALCLADADYLAFRAQVRSPQWRRRFLSQPLEDRRRQARAMRDASQAAQAGRTPAEWADVDAAAALDWLRANGCRTLIHGHTHRPGRTALDDGAERWTLGDWDHDHGLPRARLLRSDERGLHWVDAALADLPAPSPHAR